MTRVEIFDGRAVLVREGGEALRHEAQVLTTLAGPGVPEVVAVDDDGTTIRLVTAIDPPLPCRGVDVHALVTEVAGILARAHAAGLVHGPLREDHLFGRPGSVVVGGWHEAGPGDPATDVAELGRLAERLAGDDPAPRAFAARALAPRRPTMAALATPPQQHPTPPVAHRPSLPIVGLTVAAVVAIVGLLVGENRSAPAAAPVVAGTAPARSSTTTTTSTPATTVPNVVIAGNTIERDGERWTVGRPGDVVIVGDWSCTGRPVPALLRPATGQVWTFGAWLDDGAPAAGRLVATLPGAVALEVERREGCDRLRVLDAQGGATTVG